MATKVIKRVILPNPSDYINYIVGVMVDSFTENRPTTSEVLPTTQVARSLVNEESPTVLTRESVEAS